MKKRNRTYRRNRLDDMVRFVCFLVFSSAGMAAVGISFLAKPISGYYGDQAFIARQQQQIDRLEVLRGRQAELLNNIDNPSVVERAAVTIFNYIPVAEIDAYSATLPRAWPDLDKALKEIDQSPPADPAKPWQILAANLDEKSNQQMILMGLGAALILIALTCFYRRADYQTI
ncbi:MAG: hypothetical protein GY869_31450 [Planctomycetes bacterium]|nr:hypothetical protein [Planctomycetota bacterium]